MLVVVSESVLRSIRHELSVLLPEARSSHVAEALASALGFGSNAALRAAMASASRASSDLLNADGDAFAARLSSLSPASVEPDALRQAIRNAGAIAEGRGYVDLVEPRGDIPQSLASFSQAAWIFNWRMGHSRIGVMDFVEHYAPTEGGARAKALADGILAHAAVDPELASCMGRWLREAGEARGTPSAQYRCRWGDFVYWAFEPRVRALIDKACRRWDGRPPASMVDTRAARRSRGPIAYPDARVAMSGEGITPFECGRETIDTTDTLVGMAVYAMYRGGVPQSELATFVSRCEPALGDWDATRNVVSNWISCDVPGSAERPDPVRDATREPRPGWDTIVAVAVEEGVAEAYVEIDAARSPATYEARLGGSRRVVARGKASDLGIADHPLPGMEVPGFDGTVRVAEVPGSFDLALRILDPNGAMERAISRGVGKDLGQVVEEGVVFPIGMRRARAISLALETQGMPGASIGPGADLEKALPGLYRTAEYVLVDLTGENGLSEAAMRTIARGCIVGIPAIVVGADEATRDEIRSMVSTAPMVP